jgi:hypothetical protein
MINSMIFYTSVFYERYPTTFNLSNSLVILLHGYYCMDAHMCTYTKHKYLHEIKLYSINSICIILINFF